jgi:hypothetical protein
VPGGGDQDQGVGVQRDALDLGVDQRAHDPQLHLVVQDHLEDLLGAAGLDGQADVGVGGAEPGQQRRQGVGADGRGRPQDQPAGHTPAQLDQALAAVGQGGQGVLGIGQKRLPGLGQPHPAAGADEQLLAQGRLQALEAGGEGRLGDEQGLGGPAEVLAPRDLQERLDLRKHPPPSP